MEALVLTGTNKLEVKSIEKPQVKPNEVLIHTAFAGICGTVNNTLPNKSSTERPYAAYNRYRY